MTTAAKGVYFEDLSVGQEASLANTVSEADIVAFADISGDRNPVHLDAQYAATTLLERIARHAVGSLYLGGGRHEAAGAITSRRR
jgi:3-hydroxybutyryl-CoA dehydratase